MNERQAIMELDKVNKLEEKIEVVINHFEQYVQHRIDDKAQHTQKIIEQNLHMIIAHLKNIRHHLKDRRTIKLVRKEEEILSNLKKVVEDLAKNPDHIKKDTWKINELRKSLMIVEKQEKQ